MIVTVHAWARPGLLRLRRLCWLSSSRLLCEAILIRCCIVCTHALGPVVSVCGPLCSYISHSEAVETRIHHVETMGIRVDELVHRSVRGIVASRDVLPASWETLLRCA